MRSRRSLAHSGLTTWKKSSNKWRTPWHVFLAFVGAFRAHHSKRTNKHDELRDMCFWSSLAIQGPSFKKNDKHDELRDMCCCCSLAHSGPIIQKEQTTNGELRDMCFCFSLAHSRLIIQKEQTKNTNSVTCVFEVRWHIDVPCMKRTSKNDELRDMCLWRSLAHSRPINSKERTTNDELRDMFLDVRWHIQGPLFKKEQTENDELRDMCFWRPLAHLGLATWTEQTKCQAKSTFLGWLVLLEVGSQAVREAVWCWASRWWWGSSLAFIA